ncbi:hypothetical protein [Brevundimonas sp.]|uniref:hypothetical protein n=1 Tax=Brevundimonas sp. TaxID=1871086 RepID=UPI00391C8BC9
MKALATVVALVATTAAAQDTADWDFVVDPEQDLTAAIVAYEGGLGVFARCKDGAFHLMVTGLAPEDDVTRQIHVRFGDEDWGEEGWFVGEDPATAFSYTPALYARSFREGGTLDMVVREAGPNGENLRYVFEVPQSASAVNQTLEACGKPVDDPRDVFLADLPESGLPANLEWARQPRGLYPSGRTYERGVAVVSCLTGPGGGLRECVVETEWPADGGFGEAALRATRNGRLRNVDRSVPEVPTVIVSWTTNFRME